MIQDWKTSAAPSWPTTRSASSSPSLSPQREGTGSPSFSVPVPLLFQISPDKWSLNPILNEQGEARMEEYSPKRRPPFWKRRFYVHEIQKTFAIWLGLALVSYSLSSEERRVGKEGRS